MSPPDWVFADATASRITKRKHEELLISESEFYIQDIPYPTA
jgi:hypothetical protein